MMTVAQAASYLGISAEAVRARIQRGTLAHTKEGGKVYVLLNRPTEAKDDHDGHPKDHNDDHANERPYGVRANERKADAQVLAELRSHIGSLRSQIEHLRSELEERNEELRRKDHLLAAALKRIPPQLEALPEARESPEIASEEPAKGVVAEEERRSWWRRYFGFWLPLVAKF
jgi:excisionase family DNA binding protein